VTLASRGGAGPGGSADGSARTALLLVDFINDLDFDGGEALRPRAEAAARRTAELKRALKSNNVPAIYANDNFDQWTSNFSDLVEAYSAPDSRGRELARLLKPEREDLSVLKPRHSAFYGTPLEFLLAELEIQRLVIVGLVTEMCVLFTAHDAYVRKFQMWIPEDCVASSDAQVHERTLLHLREVLGVDTRPSTEVGSDEQVTGAGNRSAGGCKAS
jgi:nicotinamidase-related amidase